MTEKHPSADEIFSAAVQRAEGSDRSAYLDANCGDDPQLRQRVDRLLRASVDAGIAAPRSSWDRPLRSRSISPMATGKT